MPAFCTHYLFAQDLMPWAKENAKFNYIENVVNVGTQGPDIFFFQRVLPVVMPGQAGMKTGSALHKSQIEKILAAFKEYLEQNQNDIAKSYIYGFIMHYALDRNCHPFVYAMQEKMTNANKHIHNSSAHNKIEMALDSYMMYQKKGITNVKTFDTSKTIELTQNQKEEIGKLLSFVISKVLNKEVSKDQVVVAINDSTKFQQILRDKSGALNAFCKAVETPVGPLASYYKLSTFIRPKSWKKGIEYANINNKVWTSPYEDKIRNESFEELYSKALEQAKTFILNFNNMCDGKVENCSTNNISFLNGLEVK